MGGVASDMGEVPEDMGGGLLSMLPWDYNLAFGGFHGNNATSSVNDPIDDVLSDRPMQA